MHTSSFSSGDGEILASGRRPGKCDYVMQSYPSAIYLALAEALQEEPHHSIVRFFFLS